MNRIMRLYYNWKLKKNIHKGLVLTSKITTLLNAGFNENSLILNKLSIKLNIVKDKLINYYFKLNDINLLSLYTLEKIINNKKPIIKKSIVNNKKKKSKKSSK